jgi:hypothetical protein
VRNDAFTSIFSSKSYAAKKAGDHGVHGQEIFFVISWIQKEPSSNIYMCDGAYKMVLSRGEGGAIVTKPLFVT